MCSVDGPRATASRVAFCTAPDGVFGSVWMLVRVRADSSPPRASLGERLVIDCIATYGAPEPTHGSPAIMVRMSVRHCVEIFSRGDGVRPDLQSLAAAAKAGKTRPRRDPAGQSRRRRTTRARLAREAITAARWRELPRLSPLAGGTSRPGQRLEAGCRSARGRGPAELEATRRRRARGATHTHVKQHEHPSLTPTKRRSSRTASSPSRTPRSAASARC